MYIMRLDDASEYMDIPKWMRIESILDAAGVCALVGVIPNNRDRTMLERYTYDPEFWTRVRAWKLKGWTVALHGYNHVCTTRIRGLNPIHARSEFSGLTYEAQRKKIEEGIRIFKDIGLEPRVFFAPAHNFDKTTLDVLRNHTNIRIVSDTIAGDVYVDRGLYFVPQQAGRARRLPFRTVTFCYHPNSMTEADFKHLETFLNDNKAHFTSMNDIDLKDRPLGIFDRIVRFVYFAFRALRQRWREILATRPSCH